MTDGAGTTQYSYSPVGTLGALQLQQETPPQANSAITYAYDALGGMPGYEDPKGGPNWVPNPNGGGYGWESKDGRVWVPTGQGGGAHGGPHWDVQTPGDGYENVKPPKPAQE